MAVSVMILGVSGTGKSASMRNCKSDRFALVNVAKKPLPFKGNFAERYDGDSYQEAVNFMKKCKAKSIVIDDAQYLMGNEFMRRVTERGFDKFSEMAQNMWKLLNFINQDLPADKIVYLLGHIERDQDGNEKFKTMGKLIDQCINVEGTCTIVLKTHVADGQYSFLTQNSGHDTVKSPIGMFPSFAIDNDLNYVDEKIRNYYEIGEFLSDEDIKEIDEMAKKDDIPIADGKKKSRRARKEADEKEEKSTEAPQEEAETETAEEQPKRRRRQQESADNVDESVNAEKPAVATDEASTRRRRRVSENMAAEREAVEKANAEAIANANIDEDDDREEIPFKEAEEPEVKELPRRKRRGAATEETPAMNPPEETEEPVESEATTEEAAPARRRRRRG